jgi:sorting nexin-29
VPHIWNKGIVSPIAKSGIQDQQISSNTRGLTLASSVYKLYCGVIYSRLTYWAEDNDKMVQEQSGFRQGKSTHDNLITLTSLIETRKRSGLKTYAGFIDFKKAFDRIIRGNLWYKLRNMGLDGNLYRALTAIY